MMVLSDKFLKDEIEKSKIALRNLEEGKFIHEAVKEALQKELRKK